MNRDETEEDVILSSLLKRLRPFQREAYDFCTKGIISSRQFHTPANKRNEKKEPLVYRPEYLGKGRILLADEMGLGKTVTSLAIMAHYRKEEWPLLILCPASLRHTWPGEIEKFIPSLPASSVYVVTGFDDADFYENKAKRGKIQIVVATYSLLQTRSAAAKTLAQFKFKCIIVDESHNLKAVKSQRTLLALPLLRQAKRLVLLSGTPALARPVELWTQINSIAPGLFESNYTKFTNRFCNARRGRFGWDVSGLSNAGELHSKLRQIMVRRLKVDVLQELPPKQRTVVKINVPKSDRRRECEILIKELNETKKSISELVGEAAEGANLDARRLLMQAYQASGISKSAGVCDYLLEWLRGSGSQKVLIFAHHKGVLDALEVAVAKEFKGTGHIRIDGRVSSQERAARVRKFQTSSRIRVAILSMTAAGVGLTLTAATTVIFAELHWTPGVLAQAEDRCHRIGQRNAVNILYLICQDSNFSIDTQLWKMLGRKIGTLGRVVDGEKNASMNAKMVQGESLPSGKGKSVQDELQSFFSETSPQDLPSSEKKIPVKGTLMSFFKKQEKSASAAKPTPKVLSKSPPFIPHEQGQKVVWTCEACTFENSKIRPKSGWMACAMCSTSYFEGSYSSCSTTVTPSSSQPNTFIQENKSSQDNPIIIDDDDDNDNEDQDINNESLSHSKSKRKHDFGEDMSLHRVNQRKEESILTLTYSVSKNSGRITIHYPQRDNESSLINFDVNEVLSKESMDKLLEAKTNRKSSVKVRDMQISFDPDAILRVIRSLDISKMRKSSPTVQSMKSDIECFVTNYVRLREVEKKAIRDSGQAFPAIELKQNAIREMLGSSDVTHSTERYIGGAKERAQNKMEEGIADSTDLAILEGQLCAWCGGKLPRVSKLAGVSATYCSRECAEQGRLKRGGIYASTRLREQVFALEGGRCQICHIDAHALYKRICALQPAERLNALCNANWTLPKTAKALEQLLHFPKEGDFWEADHIVAVAEGGGGCGLENLRTLCVPCHARETADLRKRLKLKGKSTDSDAGQRDIRSMFKPVSQSNKRPKHEL